MSIAFRKLLNIFNYRKAKAALADELNLLKNSAWNFPPSLYVKFFVDRTFCPHPINFDTGAERNWAAFATVWHTGITSAAA